MHPNDLFNNITLDDVEDAKENMDFFTAKALELVTSGCRTEVITVSLVTAIWFVLNQAKLNADQMSVVTMAIFERIERLKTVEDMRKKYE